MTTRNLDALFAPESVALFGASQRPGSLGTALWNNLSKDFDGALFPVNPKYRELGNLPCWSRVRDLPQVPDLAIIATPPRSVPRLIRRLAERGTRAACVVSQIGGDDSDRLRQRILEAAQPGMLRVVGPGSMGVQVPGHGLNASYAHLAPNPGSLAFVAQSGALIASVLDWAGPRGIGFSHTVSLGGKLDVDFGDMLDYLASDAHTSAILLYVEAIAHARKFMSAARAAAAVKPVIVVKGGRRDAGARAAAAHSGLPAGNDAVYDAAFRRAGMLRVHTLEGLFDAVETLARARRPAGDRLIVLTNSAAIGVLASDALALAGGRLAQLPAGALAALDDVLPEGWSRRNPVDIVGDADGTRYRRALDVLLGDTHGDAILIMNCPTALASPLDCAEAVIATLGEAKGNARGRSVLCTWIGSHTAADARQSLRQHGLPVYESPDDAVSAFMQMMEYRHNQAQLIETPPSLPTLFEPDRAGAQAVIRAALERGQVQLDHAQCQAVLDAYGLDAVPLQRAATPTEAGEIAARLGGPVALKIDAPGLTRRRDVGEVVLDVEPERVTREAARLLARVAQRDPSLDVAGLLVQSMTEHPGACALAAGVFVDPDFGPVLSLARGGHTLVQHADQLLALPPLNLKLARGLLEHGAMPELRTGAGSRASVNREAVALLLVRLSHLVVDLSQVVAIELEPLLADAQGVVALGAHIGVAEADAEKSVRLAIRPYPKELEEPVGLRDGRELLLRPITPEDKPALQAGFAQLTPEQVRFRFFSPMKLLSDYSAARFSQIDYDRQMALVLSDPGVPGDSAIYAVVRTFESPGREFAEFAIVVVDAVAGMGIGTLMMERIIDYSRRRGIGELQGDVLSDNTRMLALCRKLGFDLTTDAESPGIVRATLPLRGSDAGG